MPSGRSYLGCDEHCDQGARSSTVSPLTAIVVQAAALCCLGAARDANGKAAPRSRHSQLRLSQALRLRNFQAAKLGLPRVKGRAAHPVPPTHVRRRRSGLLLLQYRDDLFFAEPAALHSVRPLRRAGIYSNLKEIAGLRPQ